MPEKKKLLYAELTFSDGIVCLAEVLGKEFKVSIGKHNGILAFPQLPDREENEDTIAWMRKGLNNPKIFKGWKFSISSGYYWGDTIEAQSGKSRVARIVIYFDKPKRDIKKRCNEIYDKLRKWIELFEIYLTLISKQGMHDTKLTSDFGDRIHLTYLDRKGKLKKAHDRSQQISINFSSVDTSLKRKDLLEIIKWSNSLNDPHTEYMLLMEALIAYGKGDYRKSILEASLVVEMLWEKILILELESKHVKPEKFMNKFQMLGRKYELIKMLEIELPRVNYQENLITIRNTAIHRKEKPNANDALKVIETTEKLLKKFLPDKTFININ